MSGLVVVPILLAGGAVIFRTWWAAPKNNRSAAAVAFGVYCLVFSAAIKYHSVIVARGLEALGVKVTAVIKEVDIRKESAIRDIQAQSEAQKRQIGQLVNQAEGTREQLAEQAQHSQELLANLRKSGEPPAWRTLSPPRRDRLRRTLASAKPGSVRVCHMTDDPGTTALAQQLLDVMKDAGWDVPKDLWGLINLSVEGIQMRVSDPDRPPAAAATLKDALRRVGLHSATVRTQPGLAQDKEVVLVVGTNPRPVTK
jgi:hypothetical protein